MTKKGYLILTIVLLLVIWSLNIHNNRDTEDNSNVLEQEALVSEQKEPDKESESDIQTESFEELYEFLNKDLFGAGFMGCDKEQLLVDSFEYSEEVKGEFVPVMLEDSIFPEELVVMLEEAFYDSCHNKTREEENTYFKVLEQLGADKFHLTVEEIYSYFPQMAAYKEQIQWDYEVYDIMHENMNGPLNCLRMFTIPSEDNRDTYIFLYKSGGSNGVVSVEKAELIDGQFVYVYDFEIQNDGKGSVIQYEGEYYYVFLQYNYQLKEYDGIRIYRLEDSPESENLQIRYLPKQYEWEQVYDSSTDVTQEMDKMTEQAEFSGECTSEPISAQTILDSEQEEPFFQYINANGDLQLELYYDEECEVGSGFRYWEDEKGQRVESFSFERCEIQSWYYPDFSSSEFGSMVKTDGIDFDENERLLYTNSVTSGSNLEGYYIYEDDSKIPAYYLELNNGAVTKPAFYRIQQNQNNWEWILLEQEDEGVRGFSEEELMNEAEWLTYHNFTEKNLFYEYCTQEAYDGGYELSLYCSADMYSGGGILRIKKTGEKFAFVFDGSEKYVTWNVNPLKVHSHFYSTGRNTYILKEKTIVEYYEGWEEQAFSGYFEFDDDKLMYMNNGVNHGGEHRFYIYKQDWEGNMGDTPRYMLELDPGWGVTFYSFENCSDSSTWSNENVEQLISEHEEQYNCNFSLASSELEEKFQGVWQVKEFVGYDKSNRYSWDGLYGKIYIFCEDAMVEEGRPGYKPIYASYTTNMEDFSSAEFLNVEWVDNRYENSEGTLVLAISSERNNNYGAAVEEMQLEFIVWEDRIIMQKNGSYFELEKVGTVELYEPLENVGISEK